MGIPPASVYRAATDGLERFDLTTELASALSHRPWPSGIHTRLLLKKPDLRVLLISMDAAACMREHHVDGTILLHVLKGSIRFSAQHGTHDVVTGHLISAAPSIMHQVDALEECAFLLTISWPDNK